MSVRSIAGVIVTLLSLTVGFFFMFLGVVQLTPAVNEDLHKELRKEFVRCARVFPLADTLDLKIDPHLYRYIVGVTQLSCGFALAIIPGGIKFLANLLLIILMCGATYTHMALGDKFDKTLPAVVCGLVLTLRLAIAQCTSSNQPVHSVPSTSYTKKKSE